MLISFRNIKTYLLLVLLFLVPIFGFATHERAGEITYRQISGLTYEITIVTYTYTGSEVDRPYLNIKWGDNTSDSIARSDWTLLANETQLNKYVARHTFPASSEYTMSFEDPTRNGGVLNIPNSVDVPFYVESKLLIDPILGINNSPILLNPPIDNSCVGQPFIHNPAAYDPDGDSLAYKLVVCKGLNGMNIPGYTYPSANVSFGVNEKTGDLYWDSPQMQGEFNVAIRIEEYRRGILIGYVTRDMQIKAIACNNHPPKIQTIEDTCVEAGDTLLFGVKSTDEDGDMITLTASGGVFILNENSAYMEQPVTGLSVVKDSVLWLTSCVNVRKNPYSIVFKAQDNGSPVNLVAMKTVNVTVVSPGPENLNAVPIGNTVHLSWSKPPCANAKGYRVYRHIGASGYLPTHCETGVPAYTGYVKIADIDNFDNVTFVDNNNGKGLTRGNEYCYMVIAWFDDGAESYASNEVCVHLKKDVPVITNISIKKTDNQKGSSYVAWSKPTEMDPSIKGPFKYLIYRSTSNNAIMTLIDSLSSINDTIYNDTLLNTSDNGLNYRVDIVNDAVDNRFLIGTTEKATSMFLTIKPFDNRLEITWPCIVPWQNDTFVVYRLNEQTLKFDSIGISTDTSYLDVNLANEHSYCYYVKSIGRYTAPGYIDPIVNLSQENCGTPIDVEPPCSPILKIKTRCETEDNLLRWTGKGSDCGADITRYNLYYSPVENGSLELLADISNVNDTTFIYKGNESIAGCYSVAAIDSFGNVSVNNPIVCVDIDSCGLYQLPNIFTPNSDNFNDLFIPYPFHFINKVNLRIFNRWGNLVFTTENPQINWDGKNAQSQQNCPDGVYYYVCDVYEQRLVGSKIRTITGFIHILR